MVADPLDALATLPGSENVEAGLEPVGEPMGDFNGFMKLVIGGQNAVLRSFGSLKCEIAMELDHGVAGLNCLVLVHLNLIVVLSRGGGGQNEKKWEKNGGGYRSMHALV